MKSSKNEGKEERTIKHLRVLLLSLILFIVVMASVLAVGYVSGWFDHPERRDCNGSVCPPEHQNCIGPVCPALKPVLYLYPETTTEVNVSFGNPEKLTTTYPLYQNGWQVTAHPNGDLYDQNGNYYYALYWESESNTPLDLEKGFYVPAKESMGFLEEKLSQIGLTPRERNEFIMYWLPKMEAGTDNFVYFMLTEELNEADLLHISPNPDSLLRVRMILKKVDHDPGLPVQILPPTPSRTGFTAIEWGGTEIK